MNEEAKEWLWREEYDSFYENAGEDLPQERVKERLEEIPDYFQREVSLILGIMEGMYENDAKFSCKEFMISLFDAMKEVEEEKDVELYIPYVWGDYPIIFPDVIVNMTNGLVGFESDESCEECVLKDSCRFYEEVNQESDKRTERACLVCFGNGLVPKLRDNSIEWVECTRCNGKGKVLEEEDEG